MRPMQIVILAATLVLTACASTEGTLSGKSCDGTASKAYKLSVHREGSSGPPTKVVARRFLTEFEQKAFAVRAGDTIVWKHKGDFSIKFPGAGPGEKSYGSKDDEVSVTMPCDVPAPPCSGDGTLALNGVCYRLYKYNVVNSAGSLDPMVIVER